MPGMPEPTNISIFDQVRTLAIAAIFSDDVFFEKVVLKGGNALALALGLSDRASLDLDFSIEADFADVEDAALRLERALTRKFLSSGYVVFDFKFERRPRFVESGREEWGGYMATFKLVEADQFLFHKNDVEALRRRSVVTGPLQGRILRIDLSKFEYTSGKLKQEFANQTIYVYSPRMLAVEKLRALCQQMPEYRCGRTPTPRARDFFDLRVLVERGNVYLPSDETKDLAKHVFEAKDVPLSLLRKIKETREFHRPDWDDVRISSSEMLQEFDYYFDFTCEQIALLESAWHI
jgi:hypothetical protein